MGKVKSAIITALLIAAIITLALFATISCDVPGSNGVDRYNSFISSITLGSEFTGDASVTVYPEGVITEEVYERDTYVEEGGDTEKKEEYEEKYTHIEELGLYVETEKLQNEEGEDISADFIASIKSDAESISDRISKKGYSSYSVAVVDTYGIKITVPTGMSYAAYKGYDSSSRSAALSAISHTVSYLSQGGALSLRSETTYSDTNAIYKELDSKNPYTFNTFFKSSRAFKKTGYNVIRIKFTADGLDNIKEILNNHDGSAYLFAGETYLSLPDLSTVENLGKTVDFTATQMGYAEDFAILIDSIARGSMLTNYYNVNNDATLVPSTPVYGEHSAIYLAVLALAIILIAAFLPVIKYKKLGLVNAIMVCAYSVAITTAILLTGVELTLGGVFTALVGLMLLSFSNFYTFEVIRRESALGRTIGAAIKTGYRKSLFGVLDVHAILVIASIFMTLVGVGELAACGLIFLIGSLLSYALYWFTRFMWYVLLSPARNKFAFCGFEREVEEDD